MLLSIVVSSVLVIESGTVSIPAYAYQDCDDITEVRFEEPCTLTEIGEYAFLGCSNIKELQLPESLKSIGEGAFRECESLEILTIPSGVKTLPKYMCAWNAALVEVTLPEGVDDIGSHAFAYCSSLSGIYLPSSVRHLGSNVFSFCSSLRDITLPKGMKEVESYCFSECVALESATLPANCNMLGELIFSGCVNLRNLTEPSPEPPVFDCDSYIFEPDETQLYKNCNLHVPEGAEAAYSIAPGWKLFFLVNPLSYCGRRSAHPHPPQICQEVSQVVRVAQLLLPCSQ